MFEAEDISKDTAANHNAVSARLGKTAQALFSISNIAITNDQRVRRDFVSQCDCFGYFFPVGRDLAHFFHSASMDGERDDVLREQEAEPFLCFTGFVADTCFDADWQAGGFGCCDD